MRKAQKLSNKTIAGEMSTSEKQLCHDLRVYSLRHRRKSSDTIEIFKILKSFSARVFLNEHDIRTKEHSIRLQWSHIGLLPSVMEFNRWLAHDLFGFCWR